MYATQVPGSHKSKKSFQIPVELELRWLWDTIWITRCNFKIGINIILKELIFLSNFTVQRSSVQEDHSWDVIWPLQIPLSANRLRCWRLIYPFAFFWNDILQYVVLNYWTTIFRPWWSSRFQVCVYIWVTWCFCQCVFYLFFNLSEI